MNSKTLGIFIILIFIALCGAAAFQFMEMQSYGLIDTLKERYFSSTEVASDVAMETSETANEE